MYEFRVIELHIPLFSDMAPNRLGHKADRRPSTTIEDLVEPPPKRSRSRKDHATEVAAGSQSRFLDDPSAEQVGSQSRFLGDPSAEQAGSQSRFLGDPSNAAEFRQFVGRLYLRNKTSGFTTQQLSAKAQSAGARGVEDFAKAGANGKHRGNMSRDILRNLRKSSKMPPLYYAEVPMNNPKKGERNVLTWMPFLLVHEVMSALVSFATGAFANMTDAVASNLRSTCKNLGVCASEFWALGCHGDGVPNQANKTIVCFTWNILSETFHERVLFAALGKDYRDHIHHQAYPSAFGWLCQVILVITMLMHHYIFSDRASASLCNRVCNGVVQSKLVGALQSNVLNGLCVVLGSHRNTFAHVVAMADTPSMRSCKCSCGASIFCSWASSPLFGMTTLPSTPTNEVSRSVQRGRCTNEVSRCIGMGGGTPELGPNWGAKHCFKNVEAIGCGSRRSMASQVGQPSKYAGCAKQPETTLRISVVKLVGGRVATL